MARAYPQVRTLRTLSDVRARIAELGLAEDLPVDDDVGGAEAPLANPIALGAPGKIANRFAILPMEGWDGTTDGRPTDLVTRRWRRFGTSGAGLIWGGEAVAVRADGRANPNQLMLPDDSYVEGLAGLREDLEAAHEEAEGSRDGLVVGLQLTHSGRFARPGADGPAPAIAYHHPVLDRRIASGAATTVLTDDQLDDLVDAFVAAAGRAFAAGFDFVDVKCCHGYLGHELLSAFDRPGRYGGDFDGRTRFLRSVIEAVSALPDGSGRIGVRLSAFDVVPFRAAADDGVGEPDWPDGVHGSYRYAFGGDGSGLRTDLAEPLALVDLLASLGVRLVCVTAGSPYYNPHVQRPAYFPPSDGYLPPEDPLVGVARLLRAARDLKSARPDTIVVGSGYSYLQEWLPQVGQAALRRGDVDVIGIGRMALSYPELPRDVLAGRPLERRLVCRTFSDCTTAPRNEMVSGCYPLDPYYKGRPERIELAKVKRAARSAIAENDDDEGAGA